MRSAHPALKPKTTSPTNPNASREFSPTRSNLPVLRFTPYAWAKLQFLRDAGETEVGGFGITPADDLLLIEDFQLVRQNCTAVSVKFDDESVADFFDEQVDRGLRPEQFARIWLHTHPGNSAQPSSTDEETFARCFSRSDWTVMFILAQGGQTYARLRFNGGPQAAIEIPIEVDYQAAFPAADHKGWEREYLGNVSIEEPWPSTFGSNPRRITRSLPFDVPEDDLLDREQAWAAFDGDEFDPYAHERSIDEFSPGSF